MKKWLPLTITFSLLGFGVATADSWYSPYCPAGTGTLKRKPGTVEHACEKLEIEDAKCPTGWDLLQDGVFKDKCQNVVPKVTNAICALNIGEDQDNWTVVVSSGPDHCVHNEAARGQRQVKCVPAGAKEQDHGNGNRDKCVTTETLTELITCPAGADHKIMGRDKCEKTTTKPPGFQ